jgi:hypothetical protein
MAEKCARKSRLSNVSFYSMLVKSWPFIHIIFIPESLVFLGAWV